MMYDTKCDMHNLEHGKCSNNSQKHFIFDFHTQTFRQQNKIQITGH